MITLKTKVWMEAFDYSGPKEAVQLSLLRSARIFLLPSDMVGGKSLDMASLPDEFPSLPFQTCIFESAGGSLIGCSQSGDVIHAFIASEIAPGRLRFGDLRIEDGQLTTRFANESESDEASSAYRKQSYKLLNFFIGQIKASRLGTERINERVKIRGPGRKEIVKIKEVIRVVPRGVSASPMFSRQIDWSHRWEVMGHWRRVGGLGKDRQGKYTVHGMTWVAPHTKGPDGKPIVPKIRTISATETLGVTKA